MGTYFRPRDLDEALEVLAREPRAVVAAGCTDLFPATVAPALSGPVLDVTGVAEMRGIATTGARVRLGAATTWSEVLAADLPPAFDMLKQAAREVGSVQIQNAGTLGGNLCNASPAADGVPCLMALDAEVDLASAAGRRVLPLSDFITGPRATALRPGELLCAVSVPAEAARGQSRFLKLGARRFLVISIAMVAARLVVEAGRISQAAVAVGACGPVAARLPGLEAALADAPVTGDLSRRVTPALVEPALSPIADVRGDAGYRRAAAVELVRRALGDLAAVAEEVA